MHVLILLCHYLNYPQSCHAGPDVPGFSIGGRAKKTKSTQGYIILLFKNFVVIIYIDCEFSGW
jgi:hypothetical protein